MIHAYNEAYLGVVKSNLAAVFDMAINGLQIEHDKFADMFINSAIAKAIEVGSPKILAGSSATEMLTNIIGNDVIITEVSQERSPEYWAGWVLSEAQWYLNKPFCEILSAISFSSLTRLYHPYHEAPEQKTIDLIYARMTSTHPLKKLRVIRNLSQSELAKISGVKLKTIQGYEQGVLDISKAQYDTLYSLARALNCKIEELIP